MSTCWLFFFVMECGVLLTPQLQNYSTHGSNQRVSLGENKEAAGDQFKAISFATELVSNEQVIEREFALESLRCGESATVTVRLQNGLSSPLKAAQITTSCGCITKLPDRLEIRRGESGELSFSITMPKNEEQFTRYVTLSDLESGRSVRLSLTCTAKQPIQVVQKSIDADSEQKFKAVLQVETAFPGEDLSGLKVVVTAPEIIGVEWKAMTKDRGEIALDIDPAKANRSDVQSICPVEFQRDGKVVASHSLVIRYPNRTIVRPEKMLFADNGVKVHAMAIVYSLELHRELQLGSRLTATIVTDRDEVGLVDCKVQKNDSSVCRVDLMIDEQTAKKVNDKFRIRLKAGKWQSLIPATLEK